MPNIAQIDLYMHKKTGEFSILRYAVDKRFGYWVASGNLVPVDANEIRSNGLSIILDHLHESAQQNPQDAQGPFATNATQKERLRFDRQHKSLSIGLTNDGRFLTLSPMRRTGHPCGFQGAGDETISIDEFSDDFFDLVLRLLEIAD